MTVVKTQTIYIPDGAENTETGVIAPGRYIVRTFYSDGTQADRPATNDEIHKYRHTFGAIDAGRALL